MDLLERPIAAQRDMTMILAALAALKKGDGSVRLPAEWTGLPGKVAEAFNDVVELNQRMAEELARLSLVVGKEGKVKQRGSLGDVRGFWKSSIDSVNLLIDDLVHPTSETARVIGAVAQGDLSQTMALEVDDRPLQGEFLRTAKTINRMVDQLLARARVVRKVKSLDRLLDQSTLLLHRDASKLSDNQRTVLADLYQSNQSLAGKKVLIVDDDMRNIFALASVLEE